MYTVIVNLWLHFCNIYVIISFVNLPELAESVGLILKRKSIVSFIKRKFIENVKEYRDRAKIDLMNRLTDGGFQRESDELSGRYKIAPTSM